MCAGPSYVQSSCAAGGLCSESRGSTLCKSPQLLSRDDCGVASGEKRSEKRHNCVRTFQKNLFRNTFLIRETRDQRHCLQPCRRHYRSTSNYLHTCTHKTALWRQDHHSLRRWVRIGRNYCCSSCSPNVAPQVQWTSRR